MVGTKKIALGTLLALGALACDGPAPGESDGGSSGDSGFAVALLTPGSIRDAGCRDVLHLEGSASHCFTLKLYPAKRAEALAKWGGYFASG